MTDVRQNAITMATTGAECADSMSEDNPSNIEQVIIGQLANVSREIAGLRTDVAVNTNETKNVTMQLAKINGSVSEHQKDIQTIKETALTNAETAKEAIRYTEQLKGEAKANQLIAEARELRIRKLEDWRIWVIAYATGGGAVAYFVLNYIVPHLTSVKVN